MESLFYIPDPATLGTDWVLSKWDDPNKVVVHKDTVQDLKNYHILGIEFLFHSFRKQFKGAILNEDEDMNCPIQVAAFLNAIYNTSANQFLVCVICPDELASRWHYHLSKHAGLKVALITPELQDLNDRFENESGIALLISLSNIKLAQDLLDYDFFSVIVDDFDLMANKLIFKKLYGEYNIGITKRNFYENPDQKLQYSLLNWSNPGCVGKIKDFYEFDNENFLNFRDNYRRWWFRLTWHFCESFKRPSTKDLTEYEEKLANWCEVNNLEMKPKTACRTTKRKKVLKIINNEAKNEPEEDMKQVLADVDDKDDYSNKEDRNNSEAESNSSGTIIYEADDNAEDNKHSHYVKLPSMDETPIVSSIIKNFETSPGPAKPNTSKYNYDQPNSFKFKYDDVFSSVIENKDVIERSSPEDMRSDFLKYFDDEQPSCSYSRGDENE